VNLPNLISLGRLLATPVNVWLILLGEWTAAFALFALAGLSDAVDGFIAKRFNMATRLGSYLDPLADKAMLMSVYVALGARGELPSWLVILVVSRDVLILGGALLLLALSQRLTIKPLRISKLNTLMQILLAFAALGGLAFAGELWREAAGPLSVLVGATTVASGASYLVEWGRRLADLGDA
jgi:cardiolipin synthase (CMP-forming)